MKKGDEVFHSTRGLGIIVDKWGSWFYCRECNAEAAHPRRSLCDTCGRPELSEPIPFKTTEFRCLGCEGIVGRPTVGYCPSCGKDQLLLQMNTNQIFLVKFASETQTVPVHEDWLKDAKKIKKIA